MPYMTWIDIYGPKPTDSDELANARVPDLIAELITEWDVPVSANEHETEPPAEPPELLDVQVMNFPGGAFIGLVIDTNSIGEATAIAMDLGNHLRNAAPALTGWTVGSLRADKAHGPNEDGEWLAADQDDRQPRFLVSAHLPQELQRLCAQYLLAGAVCHLVDPTRRSFQRVDAADVVAGTAHLWDGELAGALGGLLIAAGRIEAKVGGARPTAVSRGEGDPALAQALLDLVRQEIDTPFSGYDDDTMRGHAVVEQFKEDHQLQWDRVDSQLDHDATERQSRTQLRALLWAGLRVLATLTRALHDHAQTPWMLLAALDDSTVVKFFAHRDERQIEHNSLDGHHQVVAAAQAHLVLRAALLHPQLVEQPRPEFDRLWVDNAAAIRGPFIHLVADIVRSFDSSAIKDTLEDGTASEVREIADAMPILYDLESEEDDAYDALYDELGDWFSDDEDSVDYRRSITQMLVFLTHVAKRTNSDTVTEITCSLARNPGELAAVEIDDNDQTTDTRIRMYLLALTCSAGIDMAGRLAAELPELTSDDPRDEPALRNQATRWWDRIVATRADRTYAEIILRTSVDAEPGASLMNALAKHTGSHIRLPESLSTKDLVVGVVQVVAALSLAADDPDLPRRIIRDE